MKNYLYFHPESNCYFYEAENYYGDNGLVENVTGFSIHEKEAEKRGIFKKTKMTIRRELRFLPRHQFEIFLRAFDAFLSYEPAQLVRSCLTCDHFKESNELCELVNVRPPAKVIAFGCEKYQNIDDEIPF